MSKKLPSKLSKAAVCLGWEAKWRQNLPADCLLLSLLWYNLSCTYIILCTCKYFPHLGPFQFPAGFTTGKYWQRLVAFSSFSKLSWHFFIKKTAEKKILKIKKGVCIELNGWNQHRHRAINVFIAYLLNVVMISIKHPHEMKSLKPLSWPSTSCPLSWIECPLSPKTDTEFPAVKKHPRFCDRFKFAVDSAQAGTRCFF